MKNIYALCFILFFTIFSFAQENQNGKENKWSIALQINSPLREIPNVYEQVFTVNLTSFPEYNLMGGLSLKAKTTDKSFSLGLLGNYFIKNNYFIRARVAINKVDIEIPHDNFSDTATEYFYTASKKRNDIMGAIGVGHFFAIKKTCFYVGFDSPLLFYGNEKLHDLYEGYDLNTGAFIYSNEKIISGVNGYSVGIGSFLGFAFPFKNISFGSEISYAFLFSKYGGEATFENINIYATQNSDYHKLTYNTTMSLFEFSKVKGSFNITYNF